VVWVSKSNAIEPKQEAINKYCHRKELNKVELGYCNLHSTIPREEVLQSYAREDEIKKEVAKFEEQCHLAEFQKSKETWEKLSFNEKVSSVFPRLLTIVIFSIFIVSMLYLPCTGQVDF
jgi:hypothetical protein